MDALGMLQRLGAGQHVADLHEALVEVSEEVVVTGRKGKVTVTYTISKVGDEPEVVIEETIGKAPPKRDARGAIAYIMDGEFHTRDPRAPELPTFRQVEPTTTEARTATTNEGEVREMTR